MYNICTSFTTSKYSIRILRRFILKLKKNNIVKMDIRLVDNTKKTLMNVRILYSLRHIQSHCEMVLC